MLIITSVTVRSFFAEGTPVTGWRSLPQMCLRTAEVGRDRGWESGPVIGPGVATRSR
jgi:hypothetical protein